MTTGAALATFLNAFFGSLITLWAGVTTDALPDVRFLVQSVTAAVIAGMVSLMAYVQIWVQAQMKNGG